MTIDIATENGQWSLDRLVARYVEFQSSLVGTSSLYGQVGRHSRQRSEIHSGNAIVDLVAIAESFSAARLTSISSPQLSMALTWKARQKAWMKVANVNLESYEKWDQLMGFVETRNALQHGLGRLTDHQLDKYKMETLRRIDFARIERNGSKLIICPSNVSNAMKVCRGFISWLDLAAPAA